ncbi:MAG: hypothetical protein WD431_12870 [Cyclobacteriaceae bacterium]
MFNFFVPKPSRVCACWQSTGGLRKLHETGTLDYVCGDGGFVLGDKPIILSVFLENFKSLAEAESAIGSITIKAYDDFGRQHLVLSVKF